ncbi:MAG: hypothetical protein M3O06_04065, partial [Pseudomonadota bacterium]|nr:hypothetical protein [Pseudomonadota bacterium]
MRQCVVAVAEGSEKNWEASMKALTRCNYALAIAGWLCAAAGAAFAAGIADISNLDASHAIKGALEQGASSAVAKLRIRRRIHQRLAGQNPVAGGARECVEGTAHA